LSHELAIRQGQRRWIRLSGAPLPYCRDFVLAVETTAGKKTQRAKTEHKPEYLAPAGILLLWI
jgi:hypothetical protein